jgi:tRNA wybutosine-synthesizing protein 1
MHTLPKQLYVSIVAPNKEIYKKICSPLVTKSWEKIKKTLQILPSLNTRTVIRHTLVQGWNMDEKYTKQYAKLDDIGSPNFIEPKGYVFVGYSRKRMNLSNMPSHESIHSFSKKLAEELSYTFSLEKPESRVTLLTRDKKVNRKINF